MATKNKQKTENNKSATAETWRKPLQVPPRANAMRSFYQGAEDGTNPPVKQDDQAATLAEENIEPSSIKIQNTPQSSLEKASRERAKTQPQTKPPATIPESTALPEASSAAAAGANKLTKEDLAEKLGVGIDELFDVHELLRGKSFDIYQALTESADDNGRCKITQPELMKRTGIKNRRTFYKHEDWLIGLKLLEKRHLPGDHKGVVYRIMRLSDILPISDEMVEKFQRELTDDK